MEVYSGNRQIHTKCQLPYLHQPQISTSGKRHCVIIHIGVGRCQKVCVCVGGGGGGGGGAHTHVIYVPSVKNQYKRVVFGYMVI